MAASSAQQNQEFLLLEEFDKEKDFAFLKEVVIPYFSEVFEDLERREEQSQKGYISKATFLEVRYQSKNLLSTQTCRESWPIGSTR
jgi:hypothetical protein